ncbi:unnamed protein product [Brachionus calyciflorus]|uniref:G-protein coupled receptors family 1 profile domain-containing protein n=1 Tax=Brachionus calyciflorus TaxID=104777 RepID=A0A814Q972_9BILA|nr:unnamed protein product [Brachionus calyciflorus]
MAVNFFLSVFGLYSLVLIIFGTIGNSFTIYICLRKRLRSYTTFIFIAFICFSDIFSLYIWCLDHFSEAFFKTVIEEIGIISCRVSFFQQVSSLQSSSWLLVALSLDRYLGVRFRTWRSLYFKAHQAVFCSFALIFLILIINSQILVLAGDETDGDFDCYYNDAHHGWVKTWTKVHTYLYSIIPSIFLAILNTMVFYKTWKNNMRISNGISDVESNKIRKKRFGLVIAILTLGFMLTTLPSAIITGYFHSSLNSRNETKIYIYICDSMAFTYHSSKFIVLAISNTQFKKELLLFAHEFLNKLECLQERFYPNYSKSITESSG